MASMVLLVPVAIQSSTARPRHCLSLTDLFWSKSCDYCPQSTQVEGFLERANQYVSLGILPCQEGSASPNFNFSLYLYKPFLP